MEELSEKEKDYLLTILYKQDWTEAEICDSIICKLELNRIQSQNNKTEKICPIIQLIKLTREKIEKDKQQIDKEESKIKMNDYTECPYRIVIKEIQRDYKMEDIKKEKCISPNKCFNKDCPANKKKQDIR